MLCVRELLAHREGTAGSLMTSEVATVPRDVTTTEAVELLRALPERPPFLHYVYVLDAEGRLCGALALADVVLASPGTNPSLS